MPAGRDSRMERDVGFQFHMPIYLSAHTGITANRRVKNEVNSLRNKRSMYFSYEYILSALLHFQPDYLRVRALHICTASGATFVQASSAMIDRFNNPIVAPAAGGKASFPTQSTTLLSEMKNPASASGAEPFTPEQAPGCFLTSIKRTTARQCGRWCFRFGSYPRPSIDGYLRRNPAERTDY